jgi:hypothetical protein
MGLLRDALDLGLLTLDQYEDISEDWSDWGSGARHYGEVEDIQHMVEDFLDLGFEDLAEEATLLWFEAIGYYEELYEYTIFYSPTSERWHNVETGEFVSDPYEWIRD